MSRCDGCLDDRRCWVCLGTGLIESRRDGMEPCRRCYASGLCALCQPITIREIGRTPTLRVPRGNRMEMLARAD